MKFVKFLKNFVNFEDTKMDDHISRPGVFDINVETGIQLCS